MPDLASEFLKIYWGDTSDPYSGRGDFLPHPIPSPAFGRAQDAIAPVLEPKPWPPSTFQPWLRPRTPTKIDKTSDCKMQV